MPIGKKKSPAKFIGAVSAGLGILKGVTSIIGAQQEKKRLREENQIAKGNYQQTRRDIQDLEITNPYKDLNTSFENTFEDMTVNQQQAQFQAQQGAQARANLLSNLQGAAGGSGIAGLAQAMANQQQTQTQQISANIGQQEAANQRASAQGAMNVQRMTQQAQQTVAYGEDLRQTNENKRQMGLLNLRSGRQQAQADFRGQIQAQKNAVMGGIGDIVGAGLGGFAAGGGFSKGGFKMDTFLGRDNNFGDVTKMLSDGSSMIYGKGGPVGNVESANAVYSGNTTPDDSVTDSPGGDVTGYDSPEVIAERLKKEQERLYNY
tara:strand:- start:99 stop:1055 length:957 start_codon:yes stop_codon:yes gene_type:complete